MTPQPDFKISGRIAGVYQHSIIGNYYGTDEHRTLTAVLAIDKDDVVSVSFTVTIRTSAGDTHYNGIDTLRRAIEIYENGPNSTQSSYDYVLHDIGEKPQHFKKLTDALIAASRVRAQGYITVPGKCVIALRKGKRRLWHKRAKRYVWVDCMTALAHKVRYSESAE